MATYNVDGSMVYFAVSIRKKSKETSTIEDNCM
jgi:hypothetical protein